VRAQSLSAFEYNLGLMDKQVRMLKALADVSPGVHSSEKSVEPPQSEVEFVAVSRQRLHELIDGLEMEIGVMRVGLERLKN